MFLKNYVETRRLGQAARLSKQSFGQHKKWLGESSGWEHLKIEGYAEAFAIALEDVQGQEDDILADTVERGLKEVLFDKDGNVKHTRFRQSEGVYKMYLQQLNPAKYAPEKSGEGNNVVIVLNHTNEGGWTESTDKAKDVDGIPEAVVISE